eukprot:m.261724 g.261724  ORF g.261724 m.261724 type:complete len:1098 (+) comp22752_c0_seq2:1934-5227(+)
MEFDAIIVTCTRRENSATYLAELKKRQAAGFLSKDAIVMSVEDPKTRVGSGGATLNALLVVTEHLSARAGLTVASADVLRATRVLILHLGGGFLCDPCGKAFTTFACTQDNGNFRTTAQNVDFLFDAVASLAAGSPSGVWVCSTEMMLMLEASAHVDWTSFESGVAVVATRAGVEYARKHGVYEANERGEVLDIVYQGKAEKLDQLSKKTPELPLVTGVVFFCSKTAERLLLMLVKPPLVACTYSGLDNGAEPLCLSLFLDVIKSMCIDVTEESFMQQAAEIPLLERARHTLYRALHGSVPVRLALVDGKCEYLPNNFRVFARSVYTDSAQRRADLKAQVRQSLAPMPIARTWAPRTHTHVQGKLHDSAVVVNSIVGSGVSADAGVVLCHSNLHHKWHIGHDSFVLGMDDGEEEEIGLQEFTLSPDTVLAQYRVAYPSNLSSAQRLHEPVWVVLGTNDSLAVDDKHAFPMGTFCNEPWQNLFQRTGITESDLWASGEVKCAATARLFPVARLGSDVTPADVLFLQDHAFDVTANPMRVQTWRVSWRVSLSAIVANSAVEEEFVWRAALRHRIADHHVAHILLHPGKQESRFAECILPVLQERATSNKGVSTLQLLDKIAMQSSDPAVCARTLACIADLLGCMAGGHGGLRSGPGRNDGFARAFHYFETDQVAHGVQLMARERANWLSSPELTIRAARHYEAAAQVIIRQATMTARQFIELEDGTQPPVGKWVTAEIAARIDIAGGWSDTPPIAYEHGGAIINIAVMLDGKRPIGVKARLTPERFVRLAIGGTDDDTTLVLDHIDQFKSYTQPEAPGALMKAAFCCSGLLSIESGESLDAQLQKLGGGVELVTWSHLPTGSGLGTSSILAGAVLAALWTVAGRKFTNSGVMHAVLHMEQMMTTGGGWQDQIGGLWPGIKLGRSANRLPLKVDVDVVPVSQEFLQTLGSHLVLIYSGKTRLARNLLQNVIRNWYARTPEIVQNCADLISNAADCAEAVKEQNLAKIGRCLSLYWEQKKIMAPGCNPEFAQNMMDALQPLVHGQSLAGAGGGGFLHIITKEPNMHAKVEEILRALPSTPPTLTVHPVVIDSEGMVVTVEE